MYFQKHHLNFLNLISLESLLNQLVYYNVKSRQDVPFVVLGHIYLRIGILLRGLLSWDMSITSRWGPMVVRQGAFTSNNNSTSLPLPITTKLGNSAMVAILQIKAVQLCKVRQW